MRTICGIGSIKQSGVRPSVSQSVTSVERAAACGGFAAECRTRKKISIDSAGRPAAASPQPGGRSTALSSKCRQCHVDSRSNEAEHKLGLLAILGLLKFWQCSLLVWNLCPDGNMHGIIYRHIGRTGLGWIDGQKSPVFPRGKSGNPKCKICACCDTLKFFAYSALH